MAIKTSESRESLKKKLRERKLEFKDEELEKVLIEYNYFNLINGIESILLSNNKPKRFNRVTLNDFLAIYKFNKVLAATILQIIDQVESKLKNSISYHFTQLHCQTLNDTMNYTLKENYVDPKESSYANNYPFVNYQNKKVYNDFDNFILFSKDYLNKLINQNDHIDSYFYSNKYYYGKSGTPVYSAKRGSEYKKYKHVAVPFWVSIETMTLGEVIRLAHYLEPEILDKVMDDFQMSLFFRSEFLNMLDIIRTLRNSCAHGSLVYRFKTPKKVKIHANLVSKFNLNPSEKGRPPGVITLFDSLKILNYFQSTKPLKSVIQNIVYRNNKHFKSKDFDLNERLLKKMGEPLLKNWKQYIFLENQIDF